MKMKTVTSQNLAIISAFARELARNLRAEPFPVEIVGGGRRKTRPGGTGSEGKKGRQTEYMEKQRKVFLKYLQLEPAGAKRNRMALARECWAIHRSEWEEAARKGVGYSSYKALAYARLI